MSSRPLVPFVVSTCLPDGADTFVIRIGEIVTQTVHGTLVFPQP